MGFFTKNPEQPAAPPAEKPVPGAPFDGVVCFGSDGWHYPVLYDAEGNDLGPDKSRPLVFKGSAFLHAEPHDVSHFHAYGLNEVELAVGGED